MKIVASKSNEVPESRLANKAEVAAWFDVSLPTIEAWIRRGCPVIRRGAKGISWQIDLMAAMRWRFFPEEEEEEGKFNPDDLPPKDRKDWYDGEKKKRDLQIQDKELYIAHEHDREVSRVFKAIATGLETLPDMLERDAGLDGHQLAPVFKVVDQLREQLYLAVAGDDEQ